MTVTTWTQLAPGYRTGSLGPLTVVVQEEDGYINATKLCRDGGKRLEHWTGNKASGGLIDAASELTGIPVSSLSSKVSRGPRSTWGTYYHPKLIVHIACWCSTQYAMLVSDIVTEYHTREEKKARRLLEQKVIAQQVELGEREDKIDRKRVKISDLKLMMAEMMAKQAENAHQTHTRLDVLQEDVTEVRGELAHVSRKLGVAKDQRVPPAESPGAVHHNLVLRLFNPKKRKNKNKRRREYACIRAQQSSIAGCLANKRRDYPEAEVILDVINPNSMNVWRRYRERYGDYIISTGIDYTLKSGYSEERMLRHMRRVIGVRHSEEAL